MSDNAFNSGDAMDIAYKSVTRTTGSGEPVEPTYTLDKYNMRDPDTPSVKSRILNNSDYGLPHYQRRMDPNALNGLSSGWTLQELADVTYEESEPFVTVAERFTTVGAKQSTRGLGGLSDSPNILPVAVLAAAGGFLLGLVIASLRR